MHQPKSARTKAPNVPAAGLPSNPEPLAANIHPLRPAGVSMAAAEPPPFDPSMTLIRMPELLAITGIGGRATVYKLLKEDPTFPKPVPLSASTARNAPVAFVLGEVQAWIRARIAARKGDAA